MPITESALIARVNRKLRCDNEAVRTARYVNDGHSLREDPNTGRFYRVDFSRNVILENHVDLVRLADQLGVMADNEELAA
jgi:hypothetical protein